MTSDITPITEWLARGTDGDSSAMQAAWSALYTQLKQAAHQQLRGNRAFQTTALVHEAWLKLSVNPDFEPLNRRHLLAMSARAMRYVLVDHARAVHAQKRGGGSANITLTADLAASAPEAEVLALHALLETLSQVDARAAQIVELRYFGGYEEREIAGMLEISESTLRRDWRRARAFLLAELKA
ncbi:MAG: ECF-type sigma factor [Nocardioides sp.]